MALDNLRELRRSGKRPEAPVLIVIGHRPEWVPTDSTRHVLLPAGAKVSDLDLRPLIGLWVAVLLNEPLRDLAHAVLCAMEEAGAKVYGLVLEDGEVHMGILEPTPQHVANLRRTWEGHR